MRVIRRSLLVELAVAIGTIRAISYATKVAVHARTTPTPPNSPPPVRETVSVLLPARDEAHRIGPGIASLCAQLGVEDLEILVLDDNSTDDTVPAVVTAACGDDRVKVLTGAPLPDGWRGKVHACAQLADAARGSVLVFVDADVTFAPDAIAAAVTLLRREGLDYVCPFPRQVVGGVAERLMQPLVAWRRLEAVVPGTAADSKEPGGLVASAQFMVVDAEVYHRCGGHSAIKGALIDDVWLAGLLKHTGARGMAVEGSGIADCRMYAGWAELRDGYTRWLWTLRPTPVRIAGLGIFALTDILPAAAALRGSRIGLAGYSATVAGRVIAGRAAGDRVFPDAFAHPLSVALSMSLWVDSLRRARRGQVHWKGRPVS